MLGRTGYRDEPETTSAPDFMLPQQEGEQDEHPAVVHDPPDIDGSGQSTPVVGKVASRHDERQLLGVHYLYRVYG